ncbi:hypothetical protein RJ639_015057 [Escallonia herrerae]|uniref:Prostaglandin E synthase 2 n=1 Tax=Escallonia herrerae TaxID=1293975 RepID=A0AA89AM89_9ASTE|nr:hypothetical protein RJ639_015057 [Escallonia herrerae]
MATKRGSITGLAALSRAFDATAAPPNPAPRRFAQAALYSTSCNPNSTARSHWFTRDWLAGNLGLGARSATHGIAGTVLFSAAASSLAQEAHAKEPPPPKSRRRPKTSFPRTSCFITFLDYYHIPYKIVEVNPISKKEIKWSDYKKVPILMVDGQQMVDSSDIINKLYQRIHPESPIDPDGNEEVTKWCHPATVHSAFTGSVLTGTGNFSFTERLVAKYAGAAAMYFVSKKLKKKHNITDERASLYEAAETWVNALDNRKFLGGSVPNLADLAVFGILRPIRHLKSGRDMVEHTRIGEWYTRMEGTMGRFTRTGE